MPMGLFGHLSNCSVAFAIYIHVHFYYRANEIIFIFPGLFNLKTLINSKKKNCINCIDINEQIFIKKIGRNHTIPPCKIITAYALKYTFWKHFSPLLLCTGT